MKRFTLALAAAAALAIPAISVHAETPDPSGQFAHPASAGKSVAQVRAELIEAQLNGDVVLGGELGLTQRQLRQDASVPSAYAGKTREQVRAETLQAISNGDILAPGEAGVTLRQQNPQLYMARDRGNPPHWFARRGQERSTATQ